MDVFLLRHGMTAGNALRRYIGKTDEPLSPDGVKAIRLAGAYPGVRRVYVSPMLRARQTALLLFPNARLLPLPGLREHDFGAFEGRSADELADDGAYRAWVDGGCTGRCPGGEDRDAFSHRVCAAFERAADGCKRQPPLVIVAHGGTIMAVMDRYARPGRPYFDWRAENGGGYQARLIRAPGGITLTDYSLIPPGGKIGDL